jgi:hypothetical protein
MYPHIALQYEFGLAIQPCIADSGVAVLVLSQLLFAF